MLVVGVMALAGLVFVLVVTQKYGIGLGTDGVAYIQLAREFLAGRGIAPTSTLQPPLYPITLALFGAITFSDPQSAIVFAHALMFAGVILVSGMILLLHLARFPLLALLGTFGVASSLALVNVALSAFSELEFILLVLVALPAIELYVESPRVRWMVVAIAATACACLTRYIGITLLGAGALALLWLLRANIKRALAAASVYAFFSALPLALWAGRNVIVSGELFGPRAPSRVTLFENVQLTLQTTAGWFAPDEWAWLMWGVATIGLTAVLIAHMAHTRTHAANDSASTSPYVLFVAFYVAFLILTASTTGINRIGTRFLAPIFVPAWLTALVWFDRVLDWLRTRMSSQLVNAFALMVVALALVHPVQRNFGNSARFIEQGAGGYNTTRWRTSETIQYVRRHRGELLPLSYTNGPDALYILADMNAQGTPAKFRYASNVRVNEAADLRGNFPPQTATLVWFDRIERDDFLFSLPELQEIAQLTLVKKLRDGAVYRMEKR